MQGSCAPIDRRKKCQIFYQVYSITINECAVACCKTEGATCSRAIVIVRHPIDSLLAFYSHLSTLSHIKTPEDLMKGFGNDAVRFSRKYHKSAPSFFPSIRFSIPSPSLSCSSSLLLYSSFSTPPSLSLCLCLSLSLSLSHTLTHTLTNTHKHSNKLNHSQ